MRHLIALVLLVSACGGDDAATCEPAYLGGATDEAWRTMLDGADRTLAGDPMAPVFVEPGEGQIMAVSSAAPRIVWTSPLARKPHLPPVTGDIYFVEIDVPGRDCPVNALTTELEWQLDDSSWQAITAGGKKTAQIRITSAYLTENRITEGPFAPATPRTFKVE